MMSRVMSFLSGAVLSSLFALDVAVGQLDIMTLSDEEKATVSSLFLALRDNAAAMSRCDVLIRRSVFFDTYEPEQKTGMFTDENSFLRLACDFTERRFAVASSFKIVEIDFAGGGQESRSSCFAKSVDFPHDRIATYYGEGTAESRKLSTGASVIPDFEKRVMEDFGDPRSFGSWPGIFGWSFDLASKRLTDFGTGIRTRSIRQSEKETVICVTSCDNAEREELGRMTFSFDPTTNCPRKVRAENWIKSHQQWGMEYEKRYDWQETNGVMVPSRLFAEHVSARRDRAGKSHYGIEETEIQLHWISVNEKLPDNYFDGSLGGHKVLDERAVRDWLDPKPHAAEHLLPAEKSVPKKPK